MGKLKYLLLLLLLLSIIKFKLNKLIVKICYNGRILNAKIIFCLTYKPVFNSAKEPYTFYIISKYELLLKNTTK